MLQGLILLMPFMNFITSILFGRFIGYKGVFLMSTVLMMLLSSLSIYQIWGIVSDPSGAGVVYLDLGSWMEFQDLKMGYNFYFDFLSSVMILVISMVSTCVHIFSYEYMKMDPHYNSFISYLSLFTFFMLMLVSADNLIMMFFGWEGVGLCSYLLVGFWNTSPEASTAALKAFLYNSVGDMGLLLGFGLVFYFFRSFDFSMMSSLTPFYVDKEIIVLGFKVNLLSLMGVLFLIGVCGKSAQMGLHAWLPDAMEGPTPVSALMHAATMVTAGIFLILSMSFFFEFIPMVLKLMGFLGGMTGFTAGMISYMQDDMKKIMAFSTCSQLGYMIFMCGLSQYDFALFHLVNHAFFKALLFLSAGVVMHLYSNQDLSKISGINVFSVGMTLCFLLGVFSLEGFFYFSSVESKDVILEHAGHSFVMKSNMMFCFTVFTIFLTSMYASNLLDSCSQQYEMNSSILKKKPQMGFSLFIPLIILSMMAILSNMMFSKFIMNSMLFKFFIHPEHDFGASVDLLPFYFKLFLIIMPSSVVVPKIEVYKMLSFVRKFEMSDKSFFYFSQMFYVFLCVKYLTNLWETWSFMDTLPYMLFFMYFFIFLVMGPFLEKMPVMYNIMAMAIPFFSTGLFSELKSCPEVLLMYPYAYGLLLMSKISFKYKVSSPNILILWSLYYGLDIEHFFQPFDVNLTGYVMMSLLLFLHVNSESIMDKIYLFFLKVEKFSEFLMKVQMHLYSLKMFNLKKHFNFLYNKTYYDYMVNEMFNSKFFALSFWYNLFMEKGILEFMGPTGFCLTMFNMMKNVKTHFSGHKVNYICLFLFFLTQILWIWLLFS